MTSPKLWCKISFLINATEISASSAHADAVRAGPHISPRAAPAIEAAVKTSKAQRMHTCVGFHGLTGVVLSPVYDDLPFPINKLRMVLLF